MAVMYLQYYAPPLSEELRDTRVRYIKYVFMNWVFFIMTTINECRQVSVRIRLYIQELVLRSKVASLSCNNHSQDTSPQMKPRSVIKRPSLTNRPP